MHWCDILIKPCWPNKHLVVISVGAEFSSVGAEFSAVVGGPSSPWGRVLRGVDFSMGPSFGLGRVLRGAEFSGMPQDTSFRLEIDDASIGLRAWLSTPI